MSSHHSRGSMMRKELFIGPIGIIIIWYLICLLNIVNQLFLPAPHIVFSEFFRLLFSIDVWKDIGSTLLRVVVGFILAAFLGIPVGLFMGYYKKVYSAFEILIDFFRSLPALALFPLLMFIFGIGDASKIATTVFSCSLVMAVNSIYGVTNSKSTRKIVAFLMDATPSEIFLKIIFMDALPQIAIGMRTSLSLAVVVVIVTEMFIGTTWGVGHRIFEAQLTYRVPEMYSSIIIAGLIGYILNKIFVTTERILIPWNGK
ncbi:MAG: ABC transporter permease [Clostridia bacterium]|nr:ABC transporter permease [Clostridia bacterium]